MCRRGRWSRHCIAVAVEEEQAAASSTRDGLDVVYRAQWAVRVSGEIVDMWSWRAEVGTGDGGKS